MLVPVADVSGRRVQAGWISGHCSSDGPGQPGCRVRSTAEAPSCWQSTDANNAGPIETSARSREGRLVGRLGDVDARAQLRHPDGDAQRACFPGQAQADAALADEPTACHRLLTAEPLPTWVTRDARTRRR
jgi:hypothetical protein